MHGYQVDVDELRHNGNLVNELGGEFAASASLKYRMAAGEVGHEDLAGALGEFQESSRRATDILRAVTEEAATRLHETAGSYLEGDQAIADAINGQPLV